MVSVGDILSGLFGFLGPAGSILTLYLIFVLDAMLIPALPELWFVLTYSFRPEYVDPVLWGPLLLLIAILGEATGNTGLYLVVKRVLIQRGHMPKVLERTMRKWTDFLVLHDERVILMNRIAPVVPMVGAFIATLRWDFRKSIGYIVVGAVLKYAFLLVLVAYLGVVFDPGMARLITVGLVVVIVAVSAIGSYLYRKRAIASRRSP